MQFKSGSDPAMDSIDNIITLPWFRFSIDNVFMIPFVFNFILSADLNHYIVKALADLNRRFYGKPEPEEDILLETLNDYYYKNPFISYFINYSWDSWSKKFNERFQEASRSNPLSLAGFITYAAKISLLTDMPCPGDTWDQILEKAEGADDPFVKISLALYKICNFMDTAAESKRLDKYLEALKSKYPEYYRLLGVSK